MVFDSWLVVGFFLGRLLLKKTSVGFSAEWKQKDVNVILCHSTFASDANRSAGAIPQTAETETF